MERLPQTPPLAKPAQLQAQGGVTNYVTGLHRDLFNIFTRIATRANGVLPKDGTEAMTAPLPLKQYATADLPAAASYEGCIVYDSTTNTVKWSNGSVWATI